MALPVSPTTPCRPPPNYRRRVARGAGAVWLCWCTMQRYFLAAFDAGSTPLRPAVDNIVRLLAHCRAGHSGVLRPAR